MSLPHAMTTKQYAKEYCIPYSTVINRINSGAILAEHNGPKGRYVISKDWNNPPGGYVTFTPSKWEGRRDYASNGKDMEPDKEIGTGEGGFAYYAVSLQKQITALQKEVEDLKKGTVEEWPKEWEKVYYLSSYGIIPLAWHDTEDMRNVRDFMGIYRTEREAESARDFLRKCVDNRKYLEASLTW